MSWSSEGIPHSSDGAPNWAADTDPVGPQRLQREEHMSTAEFGDLNLGQAPAPAPDALAPLTLTPPLRSSSRLSSRSRLRWRAQTAPIPVSDMRDVPLGTLIFREGLSPRSSSRRRSRTACSVASASARCCSSAGSSRERSRPAARGPEGPAVRAARRGRDRSRGGAAAVGREGAPAPFFRSAFRRACRSSRSPILRTTW